MTTRRTLLLAALVFYASVLRAQASPENFTFQVFAAQTWTDTGLDLQSGDVLEISAVPAPSSSLERHAVPGAPPCDPKGVSVPTADLPLPAAPAGALLARLHAQGDPLLVGAGRQWTIEKPSHLFLGMNTSDTPPCQGSFVVKVRRISAGSGSAGEAQQKSGRAQQLKSQLETAAQIFLSGQFGSGKSDSTSSPNSSNPASSSAASGGGSSGETSSPASSFRISDTPLDADLRQSLDSLPRRVNDRFGNLGDMVNFAIVGSQKDVQTALEAANWHAADTSDEKAVLNAIEDTLEKKDYLQMPMSTLYLFGRKQDFGYEMAEPIAMVASRHHFRIWKAPFIWQGKEVWVGAGTHDTGFAKDKRNGNVTHKIDPAVDGERDNIGSSLQKANKVKTLSYYLPPNPVQEAKNATGDSYHSDGRLLVIFLQ
jgi:hypothetical protein